MWRAVLTLLVFDLVWVAFMMRPKYAKLVKHIQNGRQVEFRPAFGILAYALMVLGLVVFVIPSLETSTRSTRAIRGALFGLIVYGVYNATCATSFDRWPMDIFLLDIAWGSGVYALAAAVA